MLEQQKYLYGNFPVLEKKTSNILNFMHTQMLRNQFQIKATDILSSDLKHIARDTTDWWNQAYF